ncbi:MAG: hypothetical protein WCC80_05845, partial [Pseudolabrys sp.]
GWVAAWGARTATGDAGSRISQRRFCCELRAAIGGVPQRVGETGYVDDRNVTIEYRYAAPAIFENREFTVAGGLTSYSGSIIEAYRLAGVYTGRVLKGDKLAFLYRCLFRSSCHL